MKVLFSTEVCTSERGRAGRPQQVGWEFLYAGAKRVIPTIYRFREGIVFDVLTLLDEDACNAFTLKYADKWDCLPDTAAEEHPYQEVPLSRMLVNGYGIEGFSCSSRLFMPHEGWPDPQAEKALRRAYRRYLRGVSYFAYSRYEVPYPDSFPRHAKLPRMGRAHIHELSFQVNEVKRTLPSEVSFDLLPGERKEVAILHPQTRRRHMLHLQGMPHEELPVPAVGGRTIYSSIALYELVPALAETERLMFDSSMQYEPPSTRGREGEYLPQATDSISVIGMGDASSHAESEETAAMALIGGADGPACITVFGVGEPDAGEDGVPLQVCLSVPSFEKQECAHFHITGIEVPVRAGVQYTFRA